MNWITSKRGLAAVAASARTARGTTHRAGQPGRRLSAAEAVYNIRPADYLSSRDALTREWHSIFGSR